MAYLRLDTGEHSSRGANPTLGPLMVVGRSGRRDELPMARADLRRPRGWDRAAANWPDRASTNARPAFLRGNVGEIIPYFYTIPAYNGGYPGLPSTGCSCGGSCGACNGLGQVEFGTATLPLLGDVDWKTILLAVGGLWLGSKILAGGRRVTAGVKASVGAARRKKK